MFLIKLYRRNRSLGIVAGPWCRLLEELRGQQMANAGLQFDGSKLYHEGSCAFGYRGFKVDDSGLSLV